MATIQFASYGKLCAYQSMAEGLWENARDDNEYDRQQALDALMKGIENQHTAATATYPWKAQLPITQLAIAHDVLSNCYDNANDVGDNAEDCEENGENPEDFIFEGDVVIDPINPDAPAVDCAKAIHHAFDILTGANTIENVAQFHNLDGVVRTLHDILAQRGCESNNILPGAARLTEVMDCVIFG